MSESFRSNFRSGGLSAAAQMPFGGLQTLVERQLFSIQMYMLEISAQQKKFQNPLKMHLFLN